MVDEDVKAVGASAFPIVIPAFGAHYHVGMSLRDYFAAHAPLTVLVGAAAHVDPPRSGVDMLAIYAYQFADAMLEARKR